jgi:hypothetical protein
MAKCLVKNVTPVLFVKAMLFVNMYFPDNT